MAHLNYRNDNENASESPIRRKKRQIWNPEYIKQPEQSYVSEESFSSCENEQQVHAAEKPIRLLRISRAFRTRWDLFTMLLALYNCLTVPFFVAFYEGQNWLFFVLNTSIDVMFIIDMILNFFTTYFDRNGDEITTQKQIISHYLKGFFWLDLVASVPVDNFYLMFGNIENDSKYIQLSDLLKLIRILRLGRIIRFTRTRDDVKAALKLLQLTLYLIMWVHLTGCIWFLLVKYDQIWIPVPDFNLQFTNLYNAGIWVQYFTCFYHAVWLLTGGEVGPQNELQAFVASVLFIAGALITAVLFGEMAVLMSNLNRRQTQFQEILDGALTTMNNMKLPERLTNKILDYITQIQSSMSQQGEYETFQKFISPKLQQEVSACIYDPIISVNYVLQGEQRLTNVLVHRLHNRFTKPEQEIITEGDKADFLYFLVNGECQVFVNDINKNKHQICFLYPGAHFGEIGIVYNTVRTATVEGKGYCTIAELSKKDYESLIATFPHIIKKFRRGTDVYHDSWKKHLLRMLKQASYFNSLPRHVFNELVYFMEVVKLEKGQYLFKPGEFADAMYIVTSGDFELSLTINERQLHLLKQKARLQDIEKPPAVPKKNTSIIDYGKEFMFDIFNIDGLKNKADLVSVVNSMGVVGSIRIDDELPENTQQIGDYPQEIVLKTLKPDTLLYPNFALLKETHQLQCKALRNSTVYMLKVETIDTLCKENLDFKAEITKKRNSLQALNINKQVDLLDYEYPNKKLFQYMWKSVIVRVILNQREERKRGSSRFANLVTKIMAIVSCQEAGNFELADKVMRDEIPPHYIMKDGTLDPAASKNDKNASLPRNHPVIRAFRHIFDSSNQEGGSIIKQYGFIENTIAQQSAKLQQFDKSMCDMKNKMLGMVQNLGEDYPLKDGKTHEQLGQELENLLKFQLKRRNEKMVKYNERLAKIKSKQKSSSQQKSLFVQKIIIQSIWDQFACYQINKISQYLLCILFITFQLNYICFFNYKKIHMSDDDSKLTLSLDYAVQDEISDSSQSDLQEESNAPEKNPHISRGFSMQGFQSLLRNQSAQIAFLSSQLKQKLELIEELKVSQISLEGNNSNLKSENSSLLASLSKRVSQYEVLKEAYHSLYAKHQVLVVENQLVKKQQEQLLQERKLSLVERLRFESQIGQSQIRVLNQGIFCNQLRALFKKLIPKYSNRSADDDYSRIDDTFKRMDRLNQKSQNSLSMRDNYGIVVAKQDYERLKHQNEDFKVQLDELKNSLVKAEKQTKTLSGQTQTHSVQLVEQQYRTLLSERDNTIDLLHNDRAKLLQTIESLQKMIVGFVRNRRQKKNMADKINNFKGSQSCRGLFVQEKRAHEKGQMRMLESENYQRIQNIMKRITQLRML